MTTSANSAPSTPLNILVADDDEHVRETVRLVLEAGGHTVSVASDGEEALAMCSKRPDIVVCDVEMPKLSGFDVLERIQAQPELAGIPFIFLTGRTERGNMRRGMELGADDYVTKPFTIDELNTAVAACYRKRVTLRKQLSEFVERQRLEDYAPWSHELLTPINGVLGYATILADEALTIDREEIRKIAEGIRFSGERQLALARKLILFFALDRQKMGGQGFRNDTQASTETLSPVAHDVAGKAARATDLQIDCPAATVAVPSMMVETVATELVDNALKFSSPGSKVTLSGRTEGRSYVVTVTDEGIGMSDAEIAQVAAFRQFGREKMEQQGMGLGLALVRTFAELHGSRVAITRRSGGTGMQVKVEMPLA